jgi:hypothetical protein
VRSAKVEQAISALAEAIVDQERASGTSPLSMGVPRDAILERRIVIERGVTAFIENQMRGGTAVAIDPDDDE